MSITVKEYRKLAKLYYSDYNKISNLSVLQMYKISLRLIKFYPSTAKNNMRIAILEEYREKSLLVDEKEIKEAIDNARGFIRHLYQNEFQRRKLNFIPVFDNELDEKKAIEMSLTNTTEMEFNKSNKSRFELF